jgi:hypothetical protein
MIVCKKVIFINKILIILQMRPDSQALDMMQTQILKVIDHSLKLSMLAEVIKLRMVRNLRPIITSLLKIWILMDNLCKNKGALLEILDRNNNSRSLLKVTLSPLSNLIIICRAVPSNRTRKLMGISNHSHPNINSHRPIICSQLHTLLSSRA